MPSLPLQAQAVVIEFLWNPLDPIYNSPYGQKVELVGMTKGNKQAYLIYRSGSPYDCSCPICRNTTDPWAATAHDIEYAIMWCAPSDTYEEEEWTPFFRTVGEVLAYG